MVERYFAFEIDRPSSGIKRRDIDEGKLSTPFYSPRAGGDFRLNKPGAFLLEDLTCRQRANLSYWIYDHNRRYRLFDDELPVVNQEWVESRRDRAPSAEDRMLNFLREMIRRVDAGEQRFNDDLLNLLKAAGGCCRDEDFVEMQQYAAERGWIAKRSGSGFSEWHRINFPARLYVEERTRDLDLERQGFVAMSFDPGLKHYVFELGIEPALEAAGYKAHRIDQKDFTGGVVDELMAEIRKSRFVVADFTACKECTDDQPCTGAPGGVYYEAGFAQGLDIPVFLTCRKSCAQAMHFDIDHINRLEWETPEDLRCKLRKRIEAVVGHGPLTSPNGTQEVVDSNSSLAA